MTRAKDVMRACCASWVLRVLLIAVILGIAGSSAKAAANDGSPLGINLADWTYYSSDLAFLDVMKGASPWSGVRADMPWVNLGPLDLDAGGHVRSLMPGQIAQCLLLREIEGHYPGGRYICTYDGEGTLDFRFAASVVSRTPGRVELDIDSSKVGGVAMMLTAVNAANPVRNIRLFHSSHEEMIKSGKVFQPEFLQRWSKFKVLRFMDWQRTNNSSQSHWLNRAKPTDMSQAMGRGVAYEHMIELCNELNADAWLCIPHKATDDYVTQLAILLKLRLNSNLKVYIEYSNEIWNYGFQQGDWCAQQGLLHELVPASEGASFNARLRWQARRSVEVFKLVHNVFGSQRSRAIRTIGAQAAGLHTATNILDWQDTHNYVDAVAIAPYFYHDKPIEQLRDMTVEQVLDSAEASLPQTIGWIDGYVAEMKKRGVSLICYEGGQHMAAHWDAQVSAKFMDANRHPRMKEIYAKYLAAWKARSSGMFVLFNSAMRFSQWGSWGLMEYGDAQGEQSPKYVASVQFIDSSRTAAQPPPAKVSVYDLILARLRAMLELPGANKALILRLIEMIEAQRNASTIL